MGGILGTVQKYEYGTFDHRNIGKIRRNQGNVKQDIYRWDNLIKVINLSKNLYNIQKYNCLSRDGKTISNKKIGNLKS